MQYKQIDFISNCSNQKISEISEVCLSFLDGLSLSPVLHLIKEKNSLERLQNHQDSMLATAESLNSLVDLRLNPTDSQVSRKRF